MSSLALTPRGHLLLTVTHDAFLPSALVRRLKSAFGRGSGHGLFELGAGEVGTPLPADLSYWRDFGAQGILAITRLASCRVKGTLTPSTSKRKSS